MKKLLSMIMISGIMACACASTSPYNLKPIDRVQRWELGQAVVEYRCNGLVATVSFEHEYSGELFFDLELTNTSDKALLVSPEKFYYLAALRVHDAPISKQVFAVDPEKRVHELDKQIIEESNEQDIDRAVHLIGSIIDCVTGIAELKKEKSQEELNQEQQKEELEEFDYQTMIATSDAKISDLEQERLTWMKQTLRKSTLAAHQSLRGKVVFPREQKPDTVTLFMPVEDCLVRFAFQRDDL